MSKKESTTNKLATRDEAVKSVDVKPKKKKKKKNSKPSQQNNGPPVNVDDFSSNWKKFVSSQPKTVSKGEKEENKSTESKPKEKSDENISNNNNRRKRKRSESKCKEETPDDIWFDVDPALLKKTKRQDKNNNKNNDKNNNKNNDKYNESESDDPATTTEDAATPATVDEDGSGCGKLTKYLAIDCEMVGVGFKGDESVLARVSIVNSRCVCVYDKFVKSEEKVVDYRTHVSGVRARDLQQGTDFATVQREVSDMLKGRIVVGHAVHNDFKVLMLSHPAKDVRDTSKYKPFRAMLKTKRPALRRLVDEILHVEIQKGEHSSVVDAQMTMKLYKKFKKEWEKSLHRKGGAPCSAVEPAKKVFMGNDGEEKKKRKVNKWKKIRDRKKKKLRDE